MSEQSPMDAYTPLRSSAPLELSNIERVGATSEVLAMLAKGHSRSDILSFLRATYPAGRFNAEDIDHFMKRHRDITDAAKKANRQVAKEHVEAELKIKEQIIEMQQMVMEAMREAKAGQNFNGLSALHNSMLNSIKLVGAIEGVQTGGGEVATATELAQAIEDKNSGARDLLLEVVDAAHTKKKREDKDG